MKGGVRGGGVCRYLALEFVAANRSRGQFINLKFKASAKIENDCELTNDSSTNPKLFLLSLSLFLQILAANRAHTKVLGKSVLRDRRMASPRECALCSMRSNCIRWGKSRNTILLFNLTSLSFNPLNRTCYNANPRPDALMKEQLVEMTGLSPRVIRVWFQNKRCKDKKKTIQMKLQMQQEKVSQISWQYWFQDKTNCGLVICFRRVASSAMAPCRASRWSPARQCDTIRHWICRVWMSRHINRHGKP